MEFLLSNFSNIGNAIGWTLIHFLWQGSLLFLSYWVITRVFVKDKINLQYWIGITTIVLCLIIPINEFIYQLAINSGSNNIYQLGITAQALEINGLLHPIDMFLLLIQKIIPYLVVLWALSVLLISSHLLKSWFKLEKLSKSASHRLPENLLKKLELASNKLKLRFKPLIVISKKIIVPATFGYLKPVILLPISLISKLPQDQMEAILLHELCHIKRADFLHNILQLIVETLFFYHPLTKWISRDIRKIREQCCDELVLKLEANPLVYAKALTNIASIYNNITNSTHLQIAANDGELLNRIKFFMIEKRSKLPFTNVIIGLFFSVLTLIIINNIFQEKIKSENFAIEYSQSTKKSMIKNERPNYITPNIYQILSLNNVKPPEIRQQKELKSKTAIKTKPITNKTISNDDLNIASNAQINTTFPYTKNEVIKSNEPLNTVSPENIKSPIIPIDFKSQKRSQLPHVIKKVDPVYTQRARSRGLQGTVILSFNIDANGRVLKISYDQKSKLNSLNINAKKALKKWRFDPLSINEESLNNRYRQIFSFKLDEGLNCSVRKTTTGTRISNQSDC
jgi:TonB family protein